VEKPGGERRCDDSKVVFGGAEVRITFYLKKDAVQAFDVRFEPKDTDRIAAFAKSRYGAPLAETRDNIETPGKPPARSTSCGGKRATSAPVLVAQPDKRRGTLSVSRAISTKRSTGWR